MRVSNNWLGLEVGSEASNDITAALAAFVDGQRTDEIGLDIKAALRAFGKAFYLVDLEAAFLHLVYAVDALCRTGDLKLRAGHQRVWVCACASGANTTRFAELLKKFGSSYEVRNSLVHEGKSFVEMGENGSESAQFMQRMLGLTIDDLIRTGIKTHRKLVDTVLGRLRLPDFEEIMAAHFADEGKANGPKLPIDDDKVFKRVIEHRTRDYP